MLEKGLNPVGVYKFTVLTLNKGYARIASTVSSLDFPLQISSINPNSIGNGGM